jgi:ketosteroid isomerase-like protein
MRRVFASIFAIVCFASASAFASDKSDAVAAVHLFIDNMNKDDMKTAATAYAPQASILDEFPPHAWQGATALADWGRDFGDFAKKNGITDPVVTLGKVRHVDITGDRAYVVVEATYSYKQHGKTIREPGCFMTYALQKLAPGWRITAWSWTRP